MARSRARRLLYLVADAGVSLYGRYRSRRAAFVAHERTPIADARMGELVRVVGRLRGDGWEFRAPLTATRCLWYRTDVKNLNPGVPFLDAGVPFLDLLAFGKTITEEDSVGLFLDDDSGSAVVDARSALFSLVAMRSGWSVAAHSPSAEGAAHRFLERYAVPPGKMIYREVFLKEGDTVAVLGRPRMELDPTARGDFRTPPTRVVFDEPGEVLVSDEPGVL